MDSDDEAGGSAGVRGKTEVGPRIFRAAGGRVDTSKLGTEPVTRAPRDPNADRATLRAVRDAAQAGELERAGDMAQAALADGLEHPFLLNLCALKLETAGRLEEAAALLRRAAELAPRDPGVLNALGLCLNALERTEESLAMFDAVLALQPGLAAAHCNRGGALETLGDLTAAEASYRRALELEPGHLGATAGMASLSSRQGAHDDARRFAETVLRAEPNYPPAVMSLAAADLAQGRAGAAEDRLRALLAESRPAPLQKALAKSLLGDVLDTQGRIQEAFEAYAASGDERRRHYAGRFGGEALRAARRLADYFETAAPRDWAPPGAGLGALHAAGGARTHVFLLGFPRSGTTLLEQALAGHPEVETLSEHEPLTEAMHAFLADPEGMDRLARAGQAELDAFRDSYWRRVRAAGAAPGGKVFIDKHPLNTFKLPLIVKLFPQARILFARRDPRDVVLSCFRRRFRMSGPMYELLTLEGAAALYAAAMQLASRLQAIAPMDLRVLSHEALVTDFEAELRGVCAWLRLDWTPALHDFPARARTVATPSGPQLLGGLNADGIGQWRRYAEQMRPVLAQIEPWVERFGYDAPRERAGPRRMDGRSAGW